MIAAWLVFAVAAVFYASTWSGRYFHDGALFADMLEQGRLVWCHLAYLPAGELVHRAIRPLGFTDPEQALAALSVFSGASSVALCFAVVRRMTGDAARAWPVAALVLVTPALWFGAGIVEIHVFAAFGGCLAAWLAVTLPWGLFVVPCLTVFIAMSAHLTLACLLPGLFLLTLAAEQQRGRDVRPARAVLAGAWTIAFAVATLLLEGRLLGRGFGWEGFTNAAYAIGSQLVHPDHVAHRYVQDGLGVFGAVLTLGLLSPFGMRRGRGLVLLAVPAGLVPLIACGLAGTPLEGQYIVPALPFAAVGAAFLLPRPRRGLAAVILAAILAGHIAWSVIEWRRLGADPTGDWAKHANRVIERPAMLVCSGPNRTRAAWRACGERVFDFANLITLPATQAATLVKTKARELASEGVRVYLDRNLLVAQNGSGRELDEYAAALRALFGSPRPAQPVLEIRD